MCGDFCLDNTGHSGTTLKLLENVCLLCCVSISSVWFSVLHSGGRNGYCSLFSQTRTYSRMHCCFSLAFNIFDTVVNTKNLYSVLAIRQLKGYRGL